MQPPTANTQQCKRSCNPVVQPCCKYDQSGVGKKGNGKKGNGKKGNGKNGNGKNGNQI